MTPPRYLFEKDMGRALQDLGAYLTSAGYADCINSCRFMPYRHAESVGVMRDCLRLLPFDLRSLVRLFYLCEPVPRDDFRGAHWDEWLPLLQDAGLARLDTKDRTLCMNDIRCVVADGLYLFVTPQETKGEIAAYFGYDSIKLKRHLRGMRGQKALDVCCGSGIQSLTLAQLGMNVTGVDIQQDAVTLARINAHLNELHDLCGFKCADIRHARLDTQFDLVVSNPPLVPVPPGVKYHLCGDGGTSGNEILMSLLGQFDAITSKTGRGTFIGASMGAERASLIEDFVVQSGLAKSCRANLYIYSKVHAMQFGTATALTSAVNFQTHLHANMQLFREMCQEAGTPFTYVFLLALAKGNGAAGINVIRFNEQVKNGDWFV